MKFTTATIFVCLSASAFAAKCPAKHYTTTSASVALPTVTSSLPSVTSATVTATTVSVTSSSAVPVTTSIAASSSTIAIASSTTSGVIPTRSPLPTDPNTVLTYYNDTTSHGRVIAASCSLGQCALGDLVADTIQQQENTDIVILAAQKLNARWGPGNITYAQGLALYGANDPVLVYQWTGKQLQDVLINYLNNPGSVAPLRLLFVSGIQLQYSDQSPFLYNVIIGGKSIDLNKVYSVSSTTFTGLVSPTVGVDNGGKVQDDIVRGLAQYPYITLAYPPRISGYVPPPSTTITSSASATTTTTTTATTTTTTTVASAPTAVASGTVAKGNYDSKDCKTAECSLGDLVADCFVSESKVDVSIIASQNFYSTISEGQIVTSSTTNAILKYKDDNVATFFWTGADLKKEFEYLAGGGDGLFPQIGGIKVVYSKSAPAGSKVVSLTIGGTPVDPNKTYKIAAVDFDFQKKSICAPDVKIVNPVIGLSTQVEFAQCLSKLSSITPLTDGRITANP